MNKKLDRSHYTTKHLKNVDSYTTSKTIKLTAHNAYQEILEKHGLHTVISLNKVQSKPKVSNEINPPLSKKSLDIVVLILRKFFQTQMFMSVFLCWQRKLRTPQTPNE